MYPFAVIISFLLIGYKKISGLFKKMPLLTLILTTIFFIGIIELLNFPKFILNVLIEGMVVYFFWTTFSKPGNGKFRAPAGRLFFLFSVVVIISILINSSSPYQSYLYYRFFLSPYLFMVAIINIKLDERKSLLLIKYMEFLFLFQLVATLLKLIFYGNPEHPVGSIIVAGGGVATYLPLIAAGFLMSRYYIHERKLIYIVLVFIFPIIAYASQKRGTFIFLPVIFIFFVFILGRVDRKFKRIDKRLKYLVSLGGVAIIILIAGAKNIGLMNPEGSSGGSFDLNYLYESSVEYSTEEREYSYGRLASFLQINKVMQESEPKNKLFGFGPETLKGFTRGDGRFEQFGIGGTFPGISYQFIQIGILGAFLWLAIYLYYGIMIIKALKKEKDSFWKSIGAATLILIFLFMIDYFTYSVTFITVYAITFSVSLGFGLIMRRYYQPKS